MTPPYPFREFPAPQAGQKPQRGLKAIVYFLRIDTLEAFFNLAPSLFAKYHAKMPQANRDITLQRFLSGDCLILLATTAIGAGLDLPGINLVGSTWRGLSHWLIWFRALVE
jgi:superfamily II DNA/RNA helicase